MSAIEGMLNQVSSLRRTQQELARLSGENFNVFRILGLESREVRTHSAFLGELLNPAGSHGLKDTFLRLFIEAMSRKPVAGAKDFPAFNTAAAHLVVEYHIGRITADYQQGGRIDIYLKSAEEYIFIENKIYAGDQQNQLVRYLAHQKNARLVYLTLDGKEAPKWSSRGLTADQYEVLSYKEDITSWLEKCRQAAAAYPLVRETIVQYQHLINYLTGNTSNDFMRKEMKDLLENNQDNFASAAALVTAFAETKKQFVEIVQGQLAEKWNSWFSYDLSPLREFTIFFRFQYNTYGFYVERNKNEVNVLKEVALKPLLDGALEIHGIKRPKHWKNWDSWLGWKETNMFNVNCLPPEELYQAATDKETCTRLFEERIHEATPYFESFKNLANGYKIGADR